ncbi:non-homologous end-joining DNA ligase [Allorhizocola rhizosphaerae]|uniref:non-homologous end-joining DNA ligase n=1 Tax=Allorhizocola rhizosphaerae TaxID=1872709 RepID=UPI000E3B69DD|nr:non-homologous end-joining DNA ligase [Allorhizocola rhizosphaerae]
MRVKVGGRTLALSNLDKPMYPDGTTKAEVIDYYTRVSSVLLPHLRDRQLTRVRFPNGADAEGFYEKSAPPGKPDWVPLSRDKQIICNDLPTLVWLANLAALELHTHQWKDGHPPDRVVFDLDPGEGTGLPECRAVALALRDRLAVDGIDAYPKTSGKKGMQVTCLAPVDARKIASEFARAAPKMITDQMDKKLRPGKVFIDWSQNALFKTTVSVYSLRAGPIPTVSTPLTWDEVESGGFEMEDFTLHTVPGRIEEYGDLHAGLCF